VILVERNMNAEVWKWITKVTVSFSKEWCIATLSAYPKIGTKSSAEKQNLKAFPR
jgi:hypothetical protein